MAQEGIATLQMQGAPAPQQTVSSLDALDASKQALAQTVPGGLDEYEQAINELVSEIDLSPEEVAQLLQVVDMLLNNEARYPELRAQLIASGQADEEDLPPEFDRGYLTTILNVLLEKQARTGPTAMPAPQQFNQGGLAAAAESLRRKGRNGDTVLAHINPQEAAMLKRMGGSGTINPETGLPEFFLKKAFKAVTKPIKKVASSTVGRVVLTVALGAMLGPAGLGLSSTLAGGLAAAGTTLAAGGNLKDALISGAVGGISMGLAPSVGGVMPGTAGSFLNTALSAGAIGTGIGLLRGQKFSDALKAGALTGVTAAGIGALSNQFTPRTEGAPVFDDGLRATTVDANGNVVPVDTSVPLPSNVTATNPSGEFGIKVATPGTVSASNPSGTTAGLQSLNYRAPTYDLSAPAPAQGISSLPNAASGAAPQMTLGQIGRDIMAGNIGQAGSNALTWMGQNKGMTAALGLGAMGAMGGFKPEPVTSPGLVDRNVTGETLMAQNPNRYIVQGMPGVRYTDTGAIDYSGTGQVYQPSPGFQPSATFGSPAYGTASAPTFPVYTPPMAAAAPVAGNPVLQPYNTAAMYNFLPVNQPRFMNKGGISQVYPRRTGQISGPGTETSDDIPAMLSDGEFVITAKAVRGIGNGSRREGAKKLYRMMHAMEKKAGGKV